MNIRNSNLHLLSTLAIALLALSSTTLALNTNSYLPNRKTTPSAQSALFRGKFSRYASKSRALHATVALVTDSDLPFNRAVQTKLPGSFWSGAKSKYDLDFDWAVVKGMGFWKRMAAAYKFIFLGGLWDTIVATYALYMRRIPITIYDARAKEIEQDLSKAEFFDKYGFVLLESESAMTAEDWVASERDVKGVLKDIGNRSIDGGAAYRKRMDDFRNEDTPVKKIYAEEAKDMLKSIIPRAKTIMPPAKGIRRVLTGGLLNGPAKQVHNDYGLIFDEVVERNPFFDFDKQREIYEETKADEYMLVNFWRPIKPMSTPLRSMPLCFLDSSTLGEDDFVTIDNASLGLATALKDNPDHKFYYYPDMTVDEVVVFKQFHKFRNETKARMPVFHTAFPDPAADKDTEGRVSFEYRVGLMA